VALSIVIAPDLAADKVCATLLPEERSRCAEKLQDRISVCMNAKSGKYPSFCIKELQSQFEVCLKQPSGSQSACMRGQLGLPVPVDVCKTIAFESPRGGEKWVEGDTQTIRWSNAGNAAMSANIGLMRGNSVAKILAPNVAVQPGSKGSLKWLISDILIGDSNYTIRIVASSPNTKQCEITSGPLTLAKKKK
jgi:hypothetical protein